MLWNKKRQTLSHTKTLKKHRKSMTRPAGMNVKTQDITSQLVRFSKSVPSTLAFAMRYINYTQDNYRNKKHQKSMDLLSLGKTERLRSCFSKRPLLIKTCKKASNFHGGKE